ncbi:putative urea ABC transporter substrate-binding protein [Microbulbifer thermotolerans]|uniref:Lipid kinase n=1 Tax=Microbulbifer thermotolerans TaxID=252514 RepID=A0A143HMW4_MICTH|nr:putative urea ABC transporter substrate-binding protein [Microbulbifer thermotolerans]AMX02826.1 lipid kinase [Microbulbifer thermotolerans]MCX2779690.1 putative urea ABC transporter substrate-binding protein [Microbulbifer thermotolerans]MCX2801497.1 putative urea ABC transporter substrate-binding protein [Microbulbifer thermotolerans]MCX2804879.1 putative urea ABC transporter substrate-binding protein [Microbulbifer thermotolerans]MCX2831758.1 putative urea ABC transporter substrate-bindi
MKRLSILLLALTLSSTASARDTFKVCWSIYAGWMPWAYGVEQGIVQKWADKYDIDIEVVQFNDYIESINQYTVGEFDACSITNMDTLTIPAAGGVDNTVLIINDFSNGNDGIVLKDKTSLADIKGQKVNLVELSVSHYFLARALETVGLSERDIQVVNTSDADMVAVYGTPEVTAVATWNPPLGEILSMPGANQVFDSSQIPGEILDMLVVKTEVLEKSPELGKALTGAWFELMEIMQAKDATAKAAKTFMAQAAGTDLAGYEAQLATTAMFYTPEAALKFTNSPDLRTTMQKVAEFSFEHGLLGEGAPDAGFIGIETPAGIYGDRNNIKLRFNPAWLQMAVDGDL